MTKWGLATAEAVAADPAHYSVEFENEKVRVVRIRYGPHEHSVMHEHGPGMLVFLTDHKVRFNYPDGSSEEGAAKAGEVRWSPSVTHLPENLSDEPLELVYIEIKG